MAGTLSTQAPLIFSHWATCLQVNPVSFVHFEEQPSPSIVLPSSQSSLIKRPSPHSDTQDAPEQLGSRRQSAEQPSNGALLPSSQLSAPSTTLLPHLASVHTLGAPSHFLPSSTRQRAEQPSPATTLASSHCSLAATMPSPQRAISRHGLPGLGQLNPRSTIRQPALQPSPEALLPSSHASSEVRSPSPQPGGGGSSGGLSSTSRPLPFPLELKLWPPPRGVSDWPAPP